MVYAYDKWMQLPVRDLYDTQMMLAAVNAAKDMYEKGLQQIKDFKKEYGDFYSPIQSDMDWYKENVTDPVVNTINDLYTKGIDPIRSVEGRAAVSKLINSVNTGEIAQKKRQAEAAESYIKSRDALQKAGLWNLEYERQMLGGQLLEEWDGSLGNWTATSASPYQDYHQKYNHLFKDMDYEYDEEESKKHPGMIAMTRNKSRMHDILSSVRKDLENDPQYQYDLNNLAGAIKQQNPDILPEDALSTARKMLEDEIVERNYKGGMKLEVDPVWKNNQDFKQRAALENLRYKHNMSVAKERSKNSSSKSNTKTSPEYTSYGLTLLGNGIANFAGVSDPGAQGIRLAKSFGNNTKGLPVQERHSRFIKMYTMPNAEDTDSWTTRFRDASRHKDASPGGVRYIPTSDASKLYTQSELVSATYGCPEQWHKKKHDDLGEDVTMVPTGRVYTAPMKNGSYEQFIEVNTNTSKEGIDKTYWYKVTKTNPVSVISDNTEFSVLPDVATINQWAIHDRALNSAVGLGSEPLRSGTTYIMDSSVDDDDYLYE